MKLTDVIKQHSDRLGISYSGDDAEKVNSLLDRYHEIATEALREQKVFNDDLCTYLRAFALVLDMAANASTHGEKNARLRGCLELLESAIGKVRDHAFGVAISQHRFARASDVFRSDYPTRQYIERIRALEGELALAKQPTSLEATCDVCGKRVPAFDHIEPQKRQRIRCGACP